MRENKVERKALSTIDFPSAKADMEYRNEKHREREMPGMKKPVLVVLAAGMGSRYGGLKQIDPVGPDGELIIDYSIYDAMRAGFEKVVFIIKHEMEEDFKEIIGNRMEQNMEVAYAFQEIENTPKGYAPAKERVKPWGTAHALMSVKGIVDGPFCVINADDYYGPNAYKAIYEFLTAKQPENGKDHFCMVGYLIENTVTDKGSVARGICTENKNGYLVNIVERTKIERTDSGARFTEDDGAVWHELARGTLVSMNFWGLNEAFLHEAEAGFPAFLEQSLPINPLKCEYLLPTVIDTMIQDGKADVKILSSKDRWYGVTYREDKEGVVKAIAGMHEDGLYPIPLWGNIKR